MVTAYHVEKFYVDFKIKSNISKKKTVKFILNPFFLYH